MAKKPTKKPLTKKGEVVIALLKKYPNTPSKTLARKLYKENPEWFSGLEAARSAIRSYRGNNGNYDRDRYAHTELYRENQNAGWTPEMPPTLATPWEPYEITGPFRLLILSDIHVPYHDPMSLEAAVAYAKKKLKPDIVLFNGDIGDFFTISRWLKNPKQRDLLGEIEAIRSLLAWIAETFPKARLIYKEGNHEERWNHYLWNKAPELFNIAQCQLEHVIRHDNDNKLIGCLERLEWVGDQRPVLGGDLPIFHGHELPRGLTNPVNQARGAFLRTIHTCLTAHGHRTSTHAEPDVFHHEIVTWSQGCLCDLAPEFARVNKWNHGFAFEEAFQDKTFQLQNFRITDGEVRLS